MSVTNEDISFKFHRQIDCDAKLDQRGCEKVTCTWPTFRILGSLPYLGWSYKFQLWQAGF